MTHVYERHEACNEQHCNICHGGLAKCTVCGGAEGSLTTDCPGQRIDPDTDDAVYAGELDYRAGHWVRLKPRRCATC